MVNVAPMRMPWWQVAALSTASRASQMSCTISFA